MQLHFFGEAERRSTLLYLPMRCQLSGFFHHESAREAAQVLGVSEHAASAWLSGKSRPALTALMKVAQLYDVDTRLLMGDPLDFAAELGRRERIEATERNLEAQREFARGVVTEFRVPERRKAPK